MFGVGVLNWYSNRNPSEEIKRTTGLFSFLRGRAVDLREEENDEEVLEDEEKKRKAKATTTERAMQVTSTRAMKMIVEVQVLASLKAMNQIISF
ncbi:hypothetical protein Q3G72_021204 [Acer saccharum]|nr:hypothetical protein Q3G72_021204 [Acer saccharum]